MSGAAGEWTTIPESSHRIESGQGRTAPASLALVVAASIDEPQRAGELALVPGGPPRGAYVFGRGPEPDSEGRLRLELGRDRPGTLELTGPLRSPRVSRVQIVLRPRGAECLVVENVGRASLAHNGVRSSIAEVRPGDVLLIGGVLLLLCVRRPGWLPADAELPTPQPFGEPDSDGIVGESPAIWEVRRQIAFIARRPGHVLVLGASGAGKELVARALHVRSSRSAFPLVSRSAATLPEGILDAELFGNLRNYPNPGMTERPGLVGQAHRSSLFLDEFGALAPTQQAHLLRVLDHGEYHRLGEAEARRADLRLIAATNRPARELKEDLLARFHFRIEVPGLDQRREDVPLLLRHWLNRTSRTDPHAVASWRQPGGDVAPPLDLVERLLRHPYGTNVRELEWLAWRALMHGLPSEAAAAGLVDAPRAADAPVPGTDADSSSCPDMVSPVRVQACLDRNNGRLDSTWRELGLSSRHALARLIAKHRLEVRRRSVP